MAIYINGIGLISPQETKDNAVFLEEVIALDGDYFKIAEPPYKEYIAPRELRRMSKIIRNGIVSAKIALNDSGLENPEAILTGTGLGCAADTEKFLMAMSENKETLLTPTSFIQSTHNTLGGGIAIGLGCHNYNMTYVNRGFSFESALLDAQLMIGGGEIENALVGGFDEMTDNHSRLLMTMAHYDNEDGAVAGQGSGFFVLEENASDTTYAELKELKTIYKPEDSVIESEVENLLKVHAVDKSECIVLMGFNGVEAEQNKYEKLQKTVFENSCVAQFKNLCGEYYTSSAFAFWLASQILKKQLVPESILVSGSIPQDIKHVLIYNQFLEKEHSLILLSK
ncbi:MULTISPECIES: beta-ketoacyl synthase N-terminal-like domain-containing protein [unclassified Lentimicrobium]|uniref:beta-ketoacyl synthase N-terminal-like domain-containing protein n=1 Tax=unclassified Lentimicrobium TaxID=2677434 RepID=UPI0015516512|nr:MULTISPECIES: beta-ketoacyl synthase N-terminal-like domain-containing protein [unclassified Lentimicrobium]NPD45291.1 3-oxoacyl-ACP synthase [Lentimicrobium sp. S6]NPD84409.1 3-oxoacyl-ACP synthase [Lentimicrobium sp. L6]